MPGHFLDESIVEGGARPVDILYPYIRIKLMERGEQVVCDLLVRIGVYDDFGFFIGFRNNSVI
jgi:hypothetical protein